MIIRLQYFYYTIYLPILFMFYIHLNPWYIPNFRPRLARTGRRFHRPWPWPPALRCATPPGPLQDGTPWENLEKPVETYGNP